MKTLISKQFTLETRDFLKGLLISVIAAIVPLIQGSIKEGELYFNWPLIGTTALGAAVGYLSKNFFERTKVVTVKEGADLPDTLKK